MNPSQAVVIISDLLRTTLFVAGPLLIVALVAGVVVGIIQTATQVNEASISFLVKVTAVLGVSLAIGSHLATYLLDYTRANFEAIAQVVR
ncbi:MAG TPA: flagellar biosynthetic protein FliQ [Polyangiaceae bacterium]|jgi:flagellar biosynthetic protein FliQ|nr:flagellar biosynthetic protein FliQ [Polyangiaceae bacterium]